ncbi:inner membrane protein YbjM, partial [Salmonella enterica subsp. enterica serovar Montevideo]|nr:inner membrane protein YbjM [Salmonella enterica subsp. enterica serovar Montevideo]
FFTLPGAVASFCSHRREVIRPLIGAMLAAPFCLVLMRVVFMPTRVYVSIVPPDTLYRTRFPP